MADDPSTSVPASEPARRGRRGRRPPARRGQLRAEALRPAAAHGAAGRARLGRSGGGAARGVPDAARANRHRRAARGGTRAPPRGRRGDRRRRTARALRSRAHLVPGGLGAVELHAAREEPRSRRPDRRGSPGLLHDGERAERLRRGPRPAHRQPRGLPELPQAHPAAQRAAHERRLPLRAHRHPRLGAPPRVRAGPAHPDRQGLLHLFARRRAQHRRDRDDPPWPRPERGGAPRAAVGVERHQHQLAAAARHPDDAGDHRDVLDGAAGRGHDRSRCRGRWRR